MVKDPSKNGACNLSYYDIGDYLSREEKFDVIEGLSSIEGVNWQCLQPNDSGDWLNQRDPNFDLFKPLGAKDKNTTEKIFNIYSLGVSTNRDAWVYNMSTEYLERNVRLMITTYNNDLEQYKKASQCKSVNTRSSIEGIITNDARLISWTRGLKDDFARRKSCGFNPKAIVKSLYRPFVKEWLYFNRQLNEMVLQIPRLFPTPYCRNLLISASGVGANKPFSTLVIDSIPCLDSIEKGQCFPLYWYEKLEPADKPQMELYNEQGTPDSDGYIRHEAITDWALTSFQDHYSDSTITKEGIFWYVYGILHSPEYKSRFAADLKKMLPRIPYAKDFWAFSSAGRKLGDWHLNYESIEPFPLTEEKKRLVMEGNDYRVVKMVFGKKEGKPDKSVIVYNEHLTLRDIPLEAYEYIVNGKSALDWIMERYAITTDKPSGIVNDPNHWSDDPRYIVDLVKRIVRVSIESVRLVKGLPPLQEGH